MAMGAFDREDLHAPMADINTTPLVDVMLVLLVIFLVTAPMLTHAVKLELPRETTQAVRDQKAITLSIDAGGQYFWDATPVSDADLQQRLHTAATAGAADQPVHIRADSSASYGKISHVLALAAKFGLTNIGFITQPDQP
ncbi:MAG: ExbD/TolR family protein [Bdellovibrionales bacterium]